MHQRLPGLGNLQGRIGLGGHLAQPRADYQQQVDVLDALDQRRRRGGAEIARIDLRAVVELVHAAEGRGRRDVPGLGEGQNLLARRIAPAGTAGEEQRPLGPGQQGAELLHVTRRRGRLDLLVRPRIGHRDTVGQHVLRQCEHHRTGAAGGRHMEGARHVFGHALSLVDLRRPFGQRPEHLAVVDLLEGLAVRGVTRHLADEQDHRRRILKGRVHADRGLTGAGPARHHRDTRLAGQLAVGFGHVGRTRLMPGVDQGDTVAHVVEGVEHLKIALARHAERHLRAVNDELIDQNLTAAAGLCHRADSSVVARE